MKITPIKTHKITVADSDLFTILDQYLTSFPDNAILVIASKIVAITQGRVLKIAGKEKNELIKKEAEYYLSPEENAYNLFITLKNNKLTYSSGMDESNGNGSVVLWPKDLQMEANKIREYLIKKFSITYAGVIITDMTVIPLQRGVIAGQIAYSGFSPLEDLTNTPDLFGRPFNYAMQGIVQGLSAGAGVVMGEGANQTPLAIIEDIPFVQFQDRNPTEEELKKLNVTPEQDLFGSLISIAKWRKGGS